VTPILSSARGGRELLHKIRWDDFECAFVESASEIKIATPPRTAIEYPRGLAFGQHHELRWLTRADGRLHLVLISDHGFTLEDAEATAELAATGQSEILLWGSWDAPSGHYSEDRIPVPLVYPVPPARDGRLRIRTQLYVMRQSAPLPGRDPHAEERVTHLFRCVRLLGGQL
jgi:hypothetical protein